MCLTKCDLSQPNINNLKKQWAILEVCSHEQPIVFFFVCLVFCPYYIVDLCLNICRKPILSSVVSNINLEILMTCFASSNIGLPSSVGVRNKPSGMGALEHVQHILDAALPFTINNHTRLQHTRTAQGFSKSRLLLEITQSGDS